MCSRFLPTPSTHCRFQQRIMVKAGRGTVKHFLKVADAPEPHTPDIHRVRQHAAVDELAELVDPDAKSLGGFALSQRKAHHIPQMIRAAKIRQAIIMAAIKPRCW